MAKETAEKVGASVVKADELREAEEKGSQSEMKG